MTRLSRASKPWQGPPTERVGGSDDISDASCDVPTIVLNYPVNIPNRSDHHVPTLSPWPRPSRTRSRPPAPMCPRSRGSIFSRKSPRSKKRGNISTRSGLSSANPSRASLRKISPPCGSKKIVAEYRELMNAFYFDASCYDTSVDQLSITYPTVRTAGAAPAQM